MIEYYKFLPPDKLGMRIRGDLWTRAAYALYCMAIAGYSTQMDLAYLLKMNKTSAALPNLFARLCKYGLIEKRVVTIFCKEGSGRRIALVRLTEPGKRFCVGCRWAPVVESEWDRLVRLHQNESDNQERHTAAVLSFAYQARIRGWKVKVLPDVDDKKIRPDLLVTSGAEKVFVEVETRAHRTKTDKWQVDAQFAAASGAKLGICALSAKQRDRIVQECKWVTVTGFATDILSLTRLEANGELGDLWQKRWIFW
jgi:hypothetical protein